MTLDEAQAKWPAKSWWSPRRQGAGPSAKKRERFVFQYHDDDSGTWVLYVNTFGMGGCSIRAWSRWVGERVE